MHPADSDIGLLITACRNGDSSAQKRLYYTYFSTLMSICMRYSQDRSEAEQLVHDSFLKIFGRMNSYGGAGSFEGWMKRICINTCLDNYKRRKTFNGAAERATVSVDAAGVFEQHFAPDDVFAKLSADAILKLVDRLPEKERVVFRLHVLDGLPHDEIGSALGIKANYSYWLLHSARKQLQKLLTNAYR